MLQLCTVGKGFRIPMCLILIKPMTKIKLKSCYKLLENNAQITIAQCNLQAFQILLYQTYKKSTKAIINAFWRCS